MVMDYLRWLWGGKPKRIGLSGLRKKQEEDNSPLVEMVREEEIRLTKEARRMCKQIVKEDGDDRYHPIFGLYARIKVSNTPAEQAVKDICESKEMEDLISRFDVDFRTVSFLMKDQLVIPKKFYLELMNVYHQTGGNPASYFKRNPPESPKEKEPRVTYVDFRDKKRK